MRTLATISQRWTSHHKHIYVKNTCNTSRVCACSAGHNQNGNKNGKWMSRINHHCVRNNKSANNLAQSLWVIDHSYARNWKNAAKNVKIMSLVIWYYARNSQNSIKNCNNMLGIRYCFAGITKILLQIPYVYQGDTANMPGLVKCPLYSREKTCHGHQ